MKTNIMKKVSEICFSGCLKMAWRNSKMENNLTDQQILDKWVDDQKKYFDVTFDDCSDKAFKTEKCNEYKGKLCLLEVEFNSRLSELNNEIKKLETEELETFLSDNTVKDSVPRGEDGTKKLLKEYPNLICVRYRACNKTGKRIKTVEIKI